MPRQGSAAHYRSMGRTFNPSRTGEALPEARSAQAPGGWACRLCVRLRGYALPRESLPTLEGRVSLYRVRILWGRPEAVAECARRVACSGRAAVDNRRGSCPASLDASRGRVRDAVVLAGRAHDTGPHDYRAAVRSLQDRGLLEGAGVSGKLSATVGSKLSERRRRVVAVIRRAATPAAADAELLVLPADCHVLSLGREDHLHARMRIASIRGVSARRRRRSSCCACGSGWTR